MRRIPCLLLCTLALLVVVAPGSAPAQTSPFGPLPQAAPTETPTPEPDGNASVFGQDVGRTTLFAIAGGFVILFIGIGWWISRDARRTLPERHRPVERKPLTAAERRKRERTKARARQKTRAQRQARKAGRRR
jgi:hypothetical protein